MQSAGEGGKVWGGVGNADEKKIATLKEYRKPRPICSVFEFEESFSKVPHAPLNSRLEGKEQWVKALRPVASKTDCGSRSQMWTVVPIGRKIVAFQVKSSPSPARFNLLNGEKRCFPPKSIMRRKIQLLS